jgi:hypothetical protein
MSFPLKIGTTGVWVAHKSIASWNPAPPQGGRPEISRCMSLSHFPKFLFLLCTVHLSFFFVHSHCNYKPYTSNLIAYLYPSFPGYRISLVGFILPMIPVPNFRIARNHSAQDNAASTSIIHLQILHITLLSISSLLT